MRQKGNGIIVKGFEKFVLVFFDVMAIYVSLYVAFLMRKYVIIHIIKDLPPFDHRLQFYYSLYWIPLVVLFFNNYHKLYTRTETFWEDAKEYVKANAISFVLIITIITLSKQGDKISRILMTLFFLNILWINLILRFYIKRFLNCFKIFNKNVLIIGAGETGTTLLRALQRDRYLGYKVVGFLDNDTGKKNKVVGDTKVLGTIENLAEINSMNTIEKVFIAIPSLDSDALMELYVKLHKIFKEVVIIPQIKAMALMNSEIHHLLNYDLFLVNVRNNLNYKLNIFIKSLIDYIVVLLLLPIFLFVLIIIALLIKIESKGPVFYTHQRYALNGKRVLIYKFRSMFKDADSRLQNLLAQDEAIKAEWQNSFKLKNDPRVTRIGKLLRSTSLDELPQLINVLKGEMSFIGPRPVIAEELDKYYSKYTDYFTNVKPGITGLWQVSGRSDTDYEYRVRSDLWYILNWSIWLDMVIFIKTIFVVVKRKGAY